MVFTKEKRFTSEMVTKLLAEGEPEQSLPRIREGLQCSQSTIEKLLKDMLDRKLIKRRNVGTESKPYYLYSLRAWEGE